MSAGIFLKKIQKLKFKGKLQFKIVAIARKYFGGRKTVNMSIAS